jgi:hypothetical protein
MGQMGDKGRQMGQALKDGFANGGSGVKDAAWSMMNNVKTELDKWGGNLKDAGGRLVSGIKDGFTNGGGGIRDAASSMMQGTKDKIAEWFGAYKGVGGWIIAGLKDGMIGKIGWLQDQVTRGLTDVKNSIKSLFGIASPSKVMIEYGGYISEGLGKGITGNLDMVRSAAGDLGRAAMPSVSLSGVSAGGGGGAGFRVSGTAAAGAAVNVYVSGSVLSERDLVQVVLDGLKTYQRTNITTGLQ